MLRHLGLVFLGIFLGLAARAADAAAIPPVTGPIIELPKFEVTDSRVLPQPEKWLYAEIPGFEILSKVSKRESQRFVRDFLLLQDVIAAIMPMLLRGQTPVPTALILCGGFRGKGFDEFLPADGSVERFGSNSLFYQNAERSAIVIDFALSEIQTVDNDTRLESDPYRAFYAAYFRYLIRRQLSTAPPPWFEEGLVQLFAATDFDRRNIRFAQIGDGFGAEKIGDFNTLLHRRGLLKFGDMLNPDGPPQGRTPFWAAQCYAFVHYCLYGMGQKNQAGFVQFVRRLGDEPLSEALFKECFKKSYNQFGTELRGYIDFTAHKAIEFRAKKGAPKDFLPEPPKVEFTDAKDADVGRLKGEVLRLGGNSIEAHNWLIAPYVRGERDPRLLAAIGLDEMQAGDPERARKFLEAAANAKVQRARAYLELAKLRLEAAKAKPSGPNGQLGNEQVSNVLTPLFTARQQPPPLAEVYGLIAETWTLSALRPQPEHLAVVVEGVRMFPRDAALLMQATILAAKRDYPEEAKALAERGMKLSKDESERDRFRIIAAAFQRDESPKAPVDASTPPAQSSPVKSGPYFPTKEP